MATIAMAWYTLGNCYYFGRGVPKDLIQAMECYHNSFDRLQRYKHPTSPFATVQVIKRRYQSLQEQAREGDVESQKAVEHCVERGLFAIDRTSLAAQDGLSILGLSWKVSRYAESYWLPVATFLGLATALFFLPSAWNIGGNRATGK